MSGKILFVEDHPVVSESLAVLFHRAVPGFESCFASSGAKGLAFLNGNKFDLVVLDIQLPDISGIEFCRIAKTRHPDLKIVAVTTLAQRHVVEQMLQAGVDGFILKTSTTSDILDGIVHVLNSGERYLGKGVKELISRMPDNYNDIPMITRRESEILKMIAEGMTNQDIAIKLCISILTVDTHRKNLLMKFDARNTALLIKNAMSKGFIN
jgi:DNA-binding NarL/FixJ family response regulator